MAHITSRWTPVLPFVLFGLRSVIKEGINATAAEMVHGTTICLHSNFFQDMGVTIINVLVNQLISGRMLLYQPTLISSQSLD
ncbi:hypothetical protein TNCV_4635811 [Trichonephila clavipes]|nr:hypothetical protein TNCV_4635811 [Trichonephila clavipes]